MKNKNFKRKCQGKMNLFEQREQRLAKVRECNNRKGNKQQDESPQEKKSCISRRDEISEQMQQYAICSEDLNEVGNHLQECDDDAYDTKLLTYIILVIV